MEKKSRRGIIVGITALFLVTLILLGLTYAYYRTRIIGNPNAESISVTSKNLQLTYSDGTENVNTTGTIEPGTVITKTFTVTNDGDAAIEYAVYLEDVLNTFSRTEDVTYVLDCVNKEGAACIADTTARQYPTNNTILTTTEIAIDDVHNYTLTITYENSEVIDQSEDMGAQLAGRIHIDLPSESSELVLTLADAEEGDYATLNSEPKISYGEYDENTGSIVYRFVGVETGTHTLKVYNKNAEVKGSTSLVINNGTTTGFESGDTPTITVNGTDRVVSTTLSLSGNKVTLATPVINTVVDKEELTGVTVNLLKAEAGENSVEGLKLYASMDEAYNALQEYLGINIKSGILYYDKAKVPSKIVWTFYGDVTFNKSNAVCPYGETTTCENYAVLTGGINAVWVNAGPSGLTKTNPIKEIIVQGGNSTASFTNTLTQNFTFGYNNDDGVPYEIPMNVKIMNLKFTKTQTIKHWGNATMTISGCTFTKQTIIQINGDVNVKNNTFEFEEWFTTQYPDYYAIIFWEVEEPQRIVFENNVINSTSRGLSIGAYTADVYIKNNTFKNLKTTNTGAIQLTGAKNVVIDNNVFDNIIANAIYFYHTHDTYNVSTTITNNTIKNTAYLGQLGDDENALNLSSLNITSSGNSVSVTNPGKGISEQGTVTTNSFTLN